MHLPLTMLFIPVVPLCILPALTHVGFTAKRIFTGRLLQSPTPSSYEMIDVLFLSFEKRWKNVIYHDRWFVIVHVNSHVYIQISALGRQSPFKIRKTFWISYHLKCNRNIKKFFPVDRVRKRNLWNNGRPKNCLNRQWIFHINLTETWFLNVFFKPQQCTRGSFESGDVLITSLYHRRHRYSLFSKWYNRVVESLNHYRVLVS